MSSIKRTVCGGPTSKYFKRRKLSDNSWKEPSQRLTDSFFNKECIDLAKSLLGKKLVRKTENGKIVCKIVEAESYQAKDDKSSHSYNYKETKRNKAMFMKPGTVYVYMTYGMYYCMNISSKGPGDAVLVRAVEPIEGADIMKKFRESKQKSKRSCSEKNLSNGPSKLCQALDITKDMDQEDLTKNGYFWLEDGESIPDEAIVACKRIGLSEKHGIWAQKPLRFYILENCFVSIKDKKAESELLSRLKQ